MRRNTPEEAEAAKQRNRENQKAWVAANPQRIRELWRKAKKKNGEKRSQEAIERRRLKAHQRHARWYEQNRERKLTKNKEWFKRNPDRTRELAREGYKRNCEAEKARNKRWREAHLEHIRAYAVNWNRTHPDQYRENKRVYTGRRRGLRYSTQGKHTKKQWLQRVEYYGWRCAYCSKELTGKTVTQDHAIPLTRGGTEWASNLVPSCRSCNSKKRHLTLPEYFAKLTRLNVTQDHRNISDGRRLEPRQRPQHAAGP